MNSSYNYYIHLFSNTEKKSILLELYFELVYIVIKLFQDYFGKSIIAILD